MISLKLLSDKKQLKRNETAKNLAAPENGTLKKKGSKSRLSPRLSSRKVKLNYLYHCTDRVLFRDNFRSMIGA